MKILGRQKISADDIERRAAVLLRLYKSNYFNFVQPTPLRQIARMLTEKHKVTFDFDATLGFADSGERILGATNLKKHIVLVDGSLQQDDQKFNFTLAHELGHLALHRNLRIDYSDESTPDPPETIADVFRDKGNLITEVEWVEWQANAYATSLLLPGEIFKGAVVLQQKDMGIGRRGKIFIDNQPCNQKDFFELLNRLSLFFKVSSTAIEYRLKKFDLIEDHRKGMQSISEILKSSGFV